jgi:hypothetical protein
VPKFVPSRESETDFPCVTRKSICLLQKQLLIEAGISGGATFIADKLLGSMPGGTTSPTDVLLESSSATLPRIKISPPTPGFHELIPLFVRRTTLKIESSEIGTHDKALGLLNKVADSLFFQIDMLSGIPLSLQREPRATGRVTSRLINLQNALLYPKAEYDQAPISLYWYGRSARGMPLLQFLVFYQVVEFYFRIYSQAEARRNVRSILKDPTFREDRDADIGRVLSSIRISGTGAFGDERSQMRATLTECVDPQQLREFLESDEDRKQFYLAKTKGAAYQRISLANPSSDLRTDVADRIYDIRCKIVHTKTEAGGAELDLLLPFSKEAEQLSFDIELAQ